MDLVVVYRATDELMANSVRDTLRENGVNALVRPMFVASIGIQNPYDFGIWGEVLVDPRDLERAEEYTAGFLGTLGLLEEAEVSAEELERQSLAAGDGDKN